MRHGPVFPCFGNIDAGLAAARTVPAVACWRYGPCRGVLEIRYLEIRLGYGTDLSKKPSGSAPHARSLPCPTRAAAPLGGGGGGGEGGRGG